MGIKYFYQYESHYIRKNVWYTFLSTGFDQDCSNNVTREPALSGSISFTAVVASQF